MKRLASTLLLSYACCLPLTPALATTNRLGSVKASEYVVTAEDDPTVPSWAKQSSPPESMTTNAVSSIITNHVESGYLCTVATADGRYLKTNNGATYIYWDGDTLSFTGPNFRWTDLDEDFLVWSKAEPYVDAKIVGFRGLTNNVCAANTAFGGWTAGEIVGSSSDTFSSSQPELKNGGDYFYYSWTSDQGVAWNTAYTAWGDYDANAVALRFSSGEDYFTATRRCIAHSNDTFTTYAFVTNAIATLTPSPDFTTNNTALVNTVTNLAPSKARGISLADPVRHCNWYQSVTNGVFFWAVED